MHYTEQVRGSYPEMKLLLTRRIDCTVCRG